MAEKQKIEITHGRQLYAAIFLVETDVEIGVCKNCKNENKNKKRKRSEQEIEIQEMIQTKKVIATEEIRDCSGVLVEKGTKLFETLERKGISLIKGEDGLCRTCLSEEIEEMIRVLDKQSLAV